MKVKYLSILFLLFSCDKEKKIESYFDKNRDVITKITTLSDGLFKKYKFDALIIRSSSKYIDVWLVYNDSISDYRRKKYFFKESLIIAPISKEENNENYINSKKDYLNNLFIDEQTIQLIKIYQSNNQKAIKITKDGVFIVLQGKILSNHIDVESGLFITFNEIIDKSCIIKNIEKDVYIYEDIVENI